MEGTQYRPWWNVPSKWVSVRELVKSSFKIIIIKKNKVLTNAFYNAW